MHSIQNSSGDVSYQNSQIRSDNFRVVEEMDGMAAGEAVSTTISEMDVA